MFRHNMIGGHHRVSQLPGVKVLEDDTVVFPGIIDLEVCPAMHQSADFPPRGERSLSYVTGDLSDPGVCSGPFDVIIERRTVQLFPDAEQHEALDRLAARLGPRALFISHQHRGDWTPDQPRRHFASSWLETSGFVAESASNASSAARVARLYLTTG